MMEQVAAGGAGSKLTAVVVGHRTVVDPRLDLAEPYTVYEIQVSTRDAHGSKLQTWQVQRRYQYFRNLYQVSSQLCHVVPMSPRRASEPKHTHQ